MSLLDDLLGASILIIILGYWIIGTAMMAFERLDS